MFILDKLWNGKVSPSERKIQENCEYRKLLKELCELDKQISAELSPEGKERFCRYDDVQHDMISISERDVFIDGFRLGARLLLDVIGEYHSDFYAEHRAGQ